ncbi:hypothetical protein FF100_13015 [Methylobacterium terricola]|uniref:DUF6894 domain-containing protein n=1 Tax=Methylobacterium terricola TaxID=2583531 RepID=A0A5C4LMF3_9HYPH|nr:hypothetical protein [Methylobacterium terricola]TNC13682.1 hypothetical protein FF100_13015 [Methylobacterium terricola]
MPRYFFHIDEKRHHIDTEGIDLSCFEAAKREAMSIAGKSIIDNAATDIWPDGTWSLTVADEAAQELFIIRLSTQCRTGAGSGQVAFDRRQSQGSRP